MALGLRELQWLLEGRSLEVLRASVASLQSIDEMALCDLEDAIPRVRQAVSKIDALAQHIQEPGNAFH